MHLIYSLKTNTIFLFCSSVSETYYILLCTTLFLVNIIFKTNSFFITFLSFIVNFKIRMFNI